MIELRVKRLDENAKIPSYATDGDACFDLTAVSKKETSNYIQYGTGLAFEIPKGYVGLIFPRSSVTKKDLMLKNSVGVIDSGYRGEVSFRFKVVNRSLNEMMSEEQIDEYLDENGITDEDERNFYHDRGLTKQYANDYEIGERIGQMMVIKRPDVYFVEVDDLEDSERGEGGYGSTGE